MASTLLFLLISIPLIFSTVYTGTVYYNSTTLSYTFAKGVLDSSGTAEGFYNDTIDENGWRLLEIITNRNFADSQQMYAAGYLEGILTAPQIYQASFVLHSNPNANVVTFLQTNDQYIRQQVQINSNTDPYWKHIGLIYQQFDGLIKGYNFAASPEQQLSYLEFLLFQTTDDYDNILSKYYPSENNNEESQLDHESCSSLIKLLPDFSELYFSHVTWGNYSNMNRIFRHYYFDLQDSNTKSKGIVWSGHPGILFCVDDYYLTSSELAIMETTNDIYNNTEYTLISDQSVLTWLRVRVASVLSSSGQEWVKHFSRNWSGTYTNQWMILDYKLFTPYQPLLTNTLWIVEEIPSQVQSADVTSYLGRGDWRSYNRPFFPSIYNLSGYPQQVTSSGTDMSYDLAPRAKIFRRDVNNVIDLDSFKYLMRYNDYVNDPFGNKNPTNAISARYDLLTTNPKNFGGYDCKITSDTLIKTLTTHALSGPTNQNQPDFIWSKSPFPQQTHLGQPDVWNFTWTVFTPRLFP